MQKTASEFQGQVQQSCKSAALVAGLGAALMTSAITLTMMMSNPSPAAQN
jgi:hypothetical protein